MMHKKILGLAAMLVSGVIALNSANAALISDPLPTDAYILYNGLNWAWASPVAVQYLGDNELKEPGFHDGWRYATADEWANRPSASDFLAIPGNINSVRSASAYWNTLFTHVDYWDAVYGYVTSAPNSTLFESWYVKDPTIITSGAALYAHSFDLSLREFVYEEPQFAGIPIPAPEPSTLVLMGGALGGLILARKRLRIRD